MPSGRVLAVLLLVYVGLDFCLPAMPGVFVLAAAGYVDAADAAQARAPEAVPVVVLASGDALPLARRPPLDARRHLASTDNVVRPAPSVVICLPRARCVPPSPVEEPH
jgi:hypothetical protein